MLSNLCVRGKHGRPCVKLWPLLFPQYQQEPYLELASQIINMDTDKKVKMKKGYLSLEVCTFLIQNRG